MAVDLVLHNGVVVTPTTTFQGGVAVDDGIIVAVGADGALPDADKVLDAGGNYIFPGLLDPHVHFRDPGLTYKEDFTSGSTAAVFGGVTTVLDMPNVKPITATADDLRQREALLEQKSYIDVMLVGIIVQDNLEQIAPMAGAGAIGFKVFLGSTVGNVPAPDDGVLLDALSHVAGTGLRVGFHAENDQILQHHIRQMKASGRTDALAHLASRPAIAEVEAIQRVALFAQHTGANVHIYHLSSKEGMEMIGAYKQAGLDITTETGPHYLFLSDEDYAAQGPVIRVNPPVRSREHGQALWQGLLDGRVDFIADDHAPHTEEEKMHDNIWEAFSGFVGVETLMQVAYSECVVKRGMSLNHFVRLCSENGARVWGCYPQKGALLPGSDGDITVFDPHRPWQIDRHQLHSKHCVTPWHGWQGQGLPVGAIVRGQVLMWDREFVAQRPGGRLVRPRRK